MSGGSELRGVQASGAVGDLGASPNGQLRGCLPTGLPMQGGDFNNTGITSPVIEVLPETQVDVQNPLLNNYYQPQ